MVALVRLALVLVLMLVGVVGSGAEPSAAPAEVSWNALEKQARQLLRDRQFGPALEAARQAVTQGTQAFGKDDEQLIPRWKLVADCAERAADWATGEAAHDEVIRLQTRAHGPDDWRTREARAARQEFAALQKLSAADRRAYFQGSDSLSEAVRLRREGQQAASIKQAEVALATCEQLLGRESVAAAYVLNCLAKSTGSLGKYAEAEPLWQRSLAILEKQLGEQHPETAFALLGLGDALWRQAKAQPARPLLQRAVNSYEACYGPDSTSLAAALDSLGQACLRLNDLDAAHQAYQRSLQIREKVLGPAHVLSTTMMNQLAVVASSQGKHAEAQVFLERMVPLREKTLGPNHKDMAQAYANLGLCYQAQGKLAEAQPLLERALAIREQTAGPAHEATAATRRNLLALLRQRRDWPAAVKLAGRAAEVAQQQHGAEHLTALQSLVELTTIYRDASRFAEAQKVMQRVLAGQEKLLGADHIVMAEAHHGIAALLEAQAQYDEAEKHYRRALAIREQKLGGDHPKVADSLNALGMLAVARGDLATAAPLYSRSIEILQKAHGPGNPHTLNLLNNLAMLFQAQGNYAAATFYLRQLLPLTEQAKGAVHLDTGMVLNNLAECYREQGNNREALALFERSLAIHEKLLDGGHPKVAAALNNLANVNYNLGNFAESARTFERALQINEKVFGPEHIDTARSLDNLANAYVAQGDFARAEPLLRRALAIDEKLLGPEHRNVAVHLSSLGILLGISEKYEQAVPLVERALAIREKAFGPEHPEVAATLTNLAALEFELGRLAEAREHEARGLEIQRKHLERTSLVQSEQAQFLMTSAARLQLDGWLRTTAEMPAAPSEAWQRVLSWKGLTTSRQTALRHALSGEPLFVEFRQVSQQLSSTALNPPQPPVEPGHLAAWEKAGPALRAEWQGKLDALKRRHEQLEQALALRSALVRQDQAIRSITVADVEACLRGQEKTTALVDLIEYNYTASNRQKAGRRIAAFVVRPDHPVQRVELGAAGPIQAEVLHWRKSFGRATTDHDAGSELRRLLWQPLAPLIEGVDTVLVSSDGVLAQLPWGALPGDRPGSYLIEQVALASIPVPQMLPELLKQEHAAGLPASLLLAGDIDYGAEVSDAQFLAESRAAGRLRDGKLGSFANLAAAESELNAVRSWYEQAQGAAVDVLRRESGSEAAFREQAAQHAWLHVITHGFFAPADSDPPAAAAASDAKLGGIGIGVTMLDGRCVVGELVDESPAKKDGRLHVGDEIVAVADSEGAWQSTEGRSLGENVERLRGPIDTTVRFKVRAKQHGEETTLELRRVAVARYAPPQPALHAGLLSGLAFAGANLPPRAGNDDGILTAMEVAALDLSKVDTVVLSACETGLGEVAGGEGLLGLQRAFQVAGAKSVVASLWKVPDAATGRLMQRFYENLWKRKLGKLDALREAQIWMLREAQTTALGEPGHRGLDVATQPALKAGALPPYYWAAFVLSGDWR